MSCCGVDTCHPEMSPQTIHHLTSKITNNTSFKSVCDIKHSTTHFSHTTHDLRQTQKQRQQPWEIRRTQTRNRIPTLHSLKARPITPWITPIHNIIKDPRILIQGGVDEPNWALSNARPLLINQRNHTSPDRSSERRSPPRIIHLSDERAQLCPVGRDVGEASTGTVVNTAVGADVGRVGIDGVVG